MTRDAQRAAMPAKNRDLHGNAPDASPVVLVIVDMINDLEFPGGAALLKHAVRAASRIADLKRRVRAAHVPIVYANDNFGRWRSDFREAVERCLNDDVRGQPLAARLRPDADDYFVLKPKHSAFFATTLGLLLGYFGARRLILTGIAGDNCILRTASDAHLRDFELNVPSDCVASMSPRDNRQALAYMRRALDVDTTRSTKLDLGRLRRESKSGRAKR